VRSGFAKAATRGKHAPVDPIIILADLCPQCVLQASVRDERREKYQLHTGLKEEKSISFKLVCPFVSNKKQTNKKVNMSNSSKENDVFEQKPLTSSHCILCGTKRKMRRTKWKVRRTK